MEYYTKYIKYKKKYISLKNQNYISKSLIGGDKDNTFVDFITKHQQETIRININNDNDIIKLLKKYLNNLDKLICLDFHGITDLYSDDEKIPSNLPKCVISYIGGSPKTIFNTTNIIRSRILSNEIILGIIVYKKNNIPSCGTKGWIISKFIDVNKNIEIHFIDDSRKNIQCIDNVKSNNIKTYYINKHKNPKKYLTKVLNLI